MVIYNKTNQIQELKVYDHETKRSYSIYVCAGGSTELARSLSSPNLKKLVEDGILQVIGAPVVQSIPVVEVPTTPATHEDVEDTAPEDSEETPEGLENEIPETPETPEESSDIETEESEDVTKHICKICGGEFASARGLTNHMNKSHKE